MSTQTVSTDLPKYGSGDSSASTVLPVRFNLQWVYIVSLLIALLTAAGSLAGLLFRDDIYPAEELQRSFLANDFVTLLFGLPILLGSMWLARRGRLVGLLFWPGALFYGLYNYLAYIFGMPLNVMFPLYLTIVTLSIYATIGLVASIQGQEVKQRLSGALPERLAGAVLALFGILFILLAFNVMVSALANQNDLTSIEQGLVVADFIFSAALVVGGLLLWRRQPLGYVSGTGLFFLVNMLFVGLIVVLIIQPFVSDGPFLLTDVVILLIMSLVGIVPFALVLRGVVKS